MLKKFSSFYSSNKHIIWTLVIVGFLIYFNSLGNKMFWDDEDNILKNAYVQDWHYIGKYFTENVVAGRGILSNYWRPVVLLFWSIEWKFFRDWSGGYHFVEMVLQITNSILLFYFLLKLTGKRWLSFFVSIVFLIHPIQTEAITYATGTSDPLSALFIFVGLLIWISSIKKIKKVVSILGIYILLLMTRETAIVFPGYIVLVDLYLFFKDHPQKSLLTFIKRNCLYWGILCVLGVAYLVLRGTILNFDNTFNIYGQQTEFTSHIEYRFLTFFRILCEYFELLFYPHDLHMERVIEIVKGIGEIRVVLGIAITLVSIVSSIYFVKKTPLITFAILWFWIGIFPISNLAVPVNGLMFEHWLYLPMIGVFIILSLLGERIAKIRETRQIGIIIIIFWLGFLGVTTIKRNFEWKDPITFYNQTLKYSPNSYRILNNLGMAYADQKQQDKAIEIYNRAISIDPKNAVAYHNLGNSYKALKQKDKAIENFNKAISLNPQFFFSYNALASLYLDDGDNLMAQGTMLRYLDISPDRVSVYTTLAQIAYQGKDYKHAIYYLGKIKELIPNDISIQESINQIENLESKQ